MEQMVLVEGIGALGEIVEECNAVTESKRQSCRHGIGHGLVGSLGYTEDAMKSALDMCYDTFYPVGTTTDDSYYACYHGVFMEYHQQALHDGSMRLRPFNEAEFHEPCGNVAEGYKGVCYYRLARYWALALRPLDLEERYKKMGAYCRAIPDAQHALTCTRGVQSTIDTYSRVTDLSVAKSLCDSAFEDPEITNSCKYYVSTKLE